MTTFHYPGLAPASLRVILTAEPGAQVTPELVASVTGDAADFAAVMADLNRVHMVDENDELTPLADRYAGMCRRAIGRG
jgi:hypothetical protein